MICYALKANSNLAVICTLAKLGAGADVVSEGELRRALAAGVPVGKIVFSGVGKGEDEMALALDAGIHQFNIESEPELEVLADMAAARGRRAPVAIRLNPDVDAGTHAKIDTGRKENKFGIAIDRAHAVFARAAELPGLAIVGVAVHIGSQLTDLAPFRAAFERVAELVADLRADGHPIRRLDLGGGLGIPYHDDDVPPSPTDYAAMVREVAEPLGCEVVLEPGRLLVGNAGVLVTRVIYVKEGSTRGFVIVDAAMNDLLRPTLYDAYHAIIPVREPEDGAPTRALDVVGPVCETGDIFAAQRPLPPLQPGDLLAICSTGAYGAVMASGYNTRLPAPEVLVRGDAHAVVRPRPSYDEVLGQELMPDWLTGSPDAAARGVA